jgi:ribulose-phosphate 3-epimerase
MSSFHVSLWNASQQHTAVFKGGNSDMYRANIAAIRNAAALARGEAA